MPKGIKGSVFKCSLGHDNYSIKPGDGRKYCLTCNREAAQKAWVANGDKYRQQKNDRNRHLKMEVILAYGGECKCCGEHRYSFLTIDHINGGGNQHRREIGEGLAIYYWLKKHGYPEGFQVLCMNCNWSKSQHGYCPHTEGE